MPLDGLSPLARGTPFIISPGYFPYRFIPAGAGNSEKWEEYFDGETVYPRWRGELWTIFQTLTPSSGLSPLARGTRFKSSRADQKHRFIPAGAGNSSRWHELQTVCPVYPRWRGELDTGAEHPKTYDGLSPLARGTPTHKYLGNAMLRFIPAGAGNSLKVYICS